MGWVVGEKMVRENLDKRTRQLRTYFLAYFGKLVGYLKDKDSVKMFKILKGGWRPLE